AEAATDAVVNLALLSGAVSGEQGGLFPMEEKNNSQGALDAGVAFDLLPGYLPAPAGGKDLKGIVDGIEQGSIRALIVAGADPVATLPGGDRLRQAFAKLEHLVVVDAFPTETTRLAHVLLPAALPAEKSGSFTTPDQRRQWFDRAVSPKGEAKSDGEIFTLLSNRLTGASALFDPSQTAAELAQVAPALGSDRYKVGSVSFSALQSAPASASANRLLCGPILFHNGTMSTWSENNLSVAQAGYLELSSADAAKLGIVEGEGVRLTTTSGTITGTARISSRMPAGLFFAPYHFRDLKAPLLLSWGSNLVDVQVSRG
ncbi:MAG TPA: molybdopterin-dependent oxidoreductase, partial [Geobacterales bacterium]|nr:molybdopterin-dependent oxidoreductase [Geobacterales bacterium]